MFACPETAILEACFLRHINYHFKQLLRVTGILRNLLALWFLCLFWLLSMVWHALG